MSAAEMREALKPCPFCGCASVRTYKGHGGTKAQCRGCGVTGVHVSAWNRRAPLPEEEGMVEKAKLAMWEVCAAHSLEATNRGGARYAVTGDVVEELARAAIRAINGGKP